MTREELREHCERQIQQFERVEKLMAVTPNDWKRYEEHKLILELLEQEPRWIPVSEKKPNEGGEYLLWGKIVESEEEDYCFIGDYHEFDEMFGTEISNYDPKTLGFIDTEIEEYYSVVAWMPLPKAYREVEE